jgi:hypothetical protein
MQKELGLRAFEPTRRHLHDVFVHMVGEDEAREAELV